MYWVTSTSFKAIKKHLDTFFAANGRPSIIKSDNGPPFQSYEFAEYLKRQNIQHSRILPENPQANEVENFMRHLRKALQIAKLLHEDYKTYVRPMLMVLRATPSRTTGVSPFYAVHGRHMDPGLLNTNNFPQDKSSGLSWKETEAIHQNIVQSKLATIERTNKKPNRIHLQLQVGDQVLLRLGQRKTVEEDHFTVVSTRGSDIEARNNRTGRVFQRHLSRFTKIGENNISNEP